MINEEPKVNQNGHYSVIETAAALGISRRSLERYTLKGFDGIKCSHHRCNGRRFYTGYEIIRFWKSQK